MRVRSGRSFAITKENIFTKFSPLLQRIHFVISQLLFIVSSSSAPFTAISNIRRKGSWSFSALERELSDSASGCDFKAHSLSIAKKRCVKRRDAILQLFAQIVAAFFHSRLENCVASLFHSRAHNVFIKRNIFVTQI